MCDFNKGIKLCTCNGDKIRYRKQDFYKKVQGELIKIPNKKNENIPIIYIWHLFRYIGKDEGNFEVGQYIFPVDDIGNGLNAEWISLNLNIGNCFDFEYTPSEGDNLHITQNVEFSPYISFIYINGEWIIEHYDPFSRIIKLIYQGVIFGIKK